MNETAINNAIRKLEEMTDLLRKISKKEITQKQAADKLGITRTKEQFFQLYQEKKLPQKQTKAILLLCYIMAEEYCYNTDRK